MALVTYENKNKALPLTDVRRKFRDIDANELKSVINENQNALDATIAAAITTAINNLIGGAPGALDTLNELAAAINDDASFAAAVTSALALKQPLDSDLTFISGLSPLNDDFLQKKAGQWTNRTIAQVQTDLGIILLASFVWGEIPTGTIDGINDDFVIANSNPSRVALYIDGIRTNPSNFSITGTALTITNATVIPTNSILIDYIK